MFVPDIADEGRMTEVISLHAARLGFAGRVGQCRLLDAQIRHSHRPSSPRCRGWATYAVTADDGRAPDALLYVRGFPDGESDHEWADLGAAGRCPRGGPSGGARPDRVEVPRRSCASGARRPGRSRQGRGVPSSHRVPALDGRHVDPEDVAVDVIRYQPETSATLRCVITGGQEQEPVTLYAKVLATDPTPIGEVHEQLWARSAEMPALRIARPLGTDPDLRAVWTLGVPGPSLGSAVEPDTLASAARDVARIVAALHGCGVEVSEDGQLGGPPDGRAQEGRQARRGAARLPRGRERHRTGRPAGGCTASRRRSSTATSTSTSSSTRPTVPSSSISIRWPVGVAELDLAEVVVDV